MIFKYNDIWIICLVRLFSILEVFKNVPAILDNVSESLQKVVLYQNNGRIIHLHKALLHFIFMFVFNIGPSLLADKWRNH